VDSTASEFFAIQRDLLWAEGANIKKLSERLRNNHQDLLGSSPGFDFIFEHIGSELEKIQISYSPTKLLGVARQIGFLRFVTPTFFENKWQSYFDESKDTSLAFAKLRSWIDHQGEIFPKRFSAEALALLCHLDATATGKNPTEVAKLLINKNTQLTGFMVQGDVLFRAELQQQFYNQVKENLTEQHQHLCNAYQISDELNGHDHFLSDSFQHSVPGLKKYLES
jgi:homoserine acetyltransferase